VKNGKNAPFVMITREIFDSDKYRALTPVERDILWLLIRRYNGRNNGGISLGAREAAAWYGCGKSTANRALQGLEKARFISPVHKGHLVPVAGRENIATMWRLNFVNEVAAAPFGGRSIKAALETNTPC
jgi:hypothetical protein